MQRKENEKRQIESTKCIGRLVLGCKSLEINMPIENGEMWKEKCTRVVDIDLAVDAFAWSRMQKKKNAFVFFFSHFLSLRHRSRHTRATQHTRPTFRIELLQFFHSALVSDSCRCHTFISYFHVKITIYIVWNNTERIATLQFEAMENPEAALKMKLSQRKEKISSLLASIESIICFIADDTHASALTASSFLVQNTYSPITAYASTKTKWLSTGAWIWCQSLKCFFAFRDSETNELAPIFAISVSFQFIKRSTHNVTAQCPLPTAE